MLFEHIKKNYIVYALLLMLCVICALLYFCGVFDDDKKQVSTELYDNNGNTLNIQMCYDSNLTNQPIVVKPIINPSYDPSRSTNQPIVVNPIIAKPSINPSYDPSNSTNSSDDSDSEDECTNSFNLRMDSSQSDWSPSDNSDDSISNTLGECSISDSYDVLADNLFGTVVSLTTDPTPFFSIGTTDGKNGRTLDGNYMSNSKVKERGFAMTRDCDGAKDLGRYLLTYAIGHPYYDTKSSGSKVFGKLSGNNWSEHVKNVAVPVESIIDMTDTNDKVLVVEGNPDGTFRPVYLGKNKIYNFKGVVVRHGGVLLIDDRIDSSVVIRTEFILIESGGLFQAGSSFKPGYRYSGKLNIRLINPSYGYRYMGVVASQYSYRVYNPGVTLSDNPKKQFTSYVGEPLLYHNTFGAKSVAVGFNGSYHLAGMVGPGVHYKGTWQASSIDSNGKTKPFINQEQLLTYFKEGSKNAKLANIETQYPNVWCRLKSSLYNPGTQVIQIDPRDAVCGSLKYWQPGMQIVITCKSKTFCSDKDPVGMVPLWMDNYDNVNKTANLNANTKFINGFDKSVDKNDGVEVATISSVNGNSITLKEPLKFRHDSRATVLNRDIGNVKQIVVDTPLHVALLTRTITIESEFNPIKETVPGCNLWFADKPYESNKDSSKNYGPGGGLVCNYDPGKQNGEIYNACYKNRDSTLFCNNKKPTPIQKGHWIFGTEHLQGCNAIHGGHQKFRNGSSVKLDAVELKNLGSPGNFGVIGRYPLHFHLGGFVKSWKGYLPRDGPTPRASDRVFCRDSSVMNCTIWRCLSRWFATDGTHEIDVKNNVGFICYGSGYFIEDGTEIDNVFEHNMAIACLTASKHEYWNPIPIIPAVSSDLAPGSCFWMKNNRNKCFRNVMTNCPAPIIGIWAVPQDIAKLRGTSSVCVGDSKLGLPALASYFNARGFQDTGGLNQMKIRDTSQPNLPITKDIYSDMTGPCWMPDYMTNLKTLGEGKDKCVPFSGTNCENPYSLWSENIVYGMFAGMSEFPEALGMRIGDYKGCGPFGTTNGPHIGASPNNPVAQYLPYNGNNSCTDTNTQCTYFSTKWGGTDSGRQGYMDNNLKKWIGPNGKQYDVNDPNIPVNYAFQPLSLMDINTINSSNQKNVGVAGQPLADGIPKIFTNWLTYNLGPNGGNLWGGAGWVKNSPGWLINCCLLQDGGGTHATNPNSDGDNFDNCNNLPSSGYFGAHRSTIWSMVCGDAINTYSNAYFVLYNLISNGSVGFPPNPTIIGGDRMFLDNKADLISIEYNNMNYSSNDWYFIDVEPDAVISKQFWQGQSTYGKDIIARANYMSPDGANDYSFKIQNGIVSGKVKENFMSRTCKYPYMCNYNTHKLFRMTDSEVRESMKHFDKSNPEWLGIVVNSHLFAFMSDYARNPGGFGDKLCMALSRIPGCRNPPSNFINGRKMC